MTDTATRPIQRRPRLTPLPFDALETYITFRWGVDDQVLHGCAPNDRTQTDGRVALLTGVTTKTVLRWRHTNTIPYWSADRAAIELGAHGSAIWGHPFTNPHPEQD